MAPFLNTLRPGITLLVVASLVGCSSSKEVPKPDPADSPGMTWRIDGSAVTVTSVQKDITDIHITVSGTAGSITSGSSISVSMPKSIGTHTIAAKGSSSALYSAYTSSSNAVFRATTGTITVTALTTTKIVGTFAFSGTDPKSSTTKTITRGRFNVQL